MKEPILYCKLKGFEFTQAMWGDDGAWVQILYEEFRSLNLQNLYQSIKELDFTELVSQNEGVWIYLIYTLVMQGNSLWCWVCSVYTKRKGLLFISHAHSTDRLYICTYMCSYQQQKHMKIFPYLGIWGIRISQLILLQAGLAFEVRVVSPSVL